MPSSPGSWAARSSSSPTGWRASPPTSTPATTASRRAWPSTPQGRITAIDIDDLTGIGPYSVYPRTSAVEGNQVVNLVGGPYDFANYRAKTTVVLQNKTPTCQYRAVGHPIATAVTEGLVDLAAEALGLDPVEFRRRNLMRDDSLSAHLARRHEVRGPVAPRLARQAART